jgi:hypothetical protein
MARSDDRIAVKTILVGKKDPNNFIHDETLSSLKEMAQQKDSQKIDVLHE